jgi:transcriptional adapter 2-alpha
MLPIVGPNPHFAASIDTEEFQKRKRQRIEDARSGQAAFGGTASQQQSQGAAAKPAPPKPLVSAPTSHSELATFMPGRLEFEVEYENEAENYVKDMEFGKVYRFGGEMIPSEMEALGRKAEQGRVRMEGSGRGGPGLGQRGAKGSKEEEENGDATETQDGADDEQKEDEENADEEMKEAEDGQEDEEDEEEHEDDDQSKVDHTADGDETTVNTDSQAATTTTSQPAETDDRAADWDEDEADLELKLIVLDIYNERLSRRGRRKEFIFERNLVDYKRTVAAERKRPKEEREMLNRVRHFAQMQTTTDFEEFYNGLCYEDALRRAAAQLQMFRRAGITTLTDAARFESEQAERARRAAVAAEGGLAAFPGAGSVPRSAAARAAARETSTPGDSGSDITNVHVTQPISKKKAANGVVHANGNGTDGEKKPARKPPRPLDLSSHPSLNLLTRAEQELCSTIRIQPQVFMIMKKDIIVEYVRRKGKFSRRESRQLFKCDVNKVGKVYDLLESEGYLREAGRLGNGWDGTGTPPGWVEKPKVNGDPNAGTPTVPTSDPVPGPTTASSIKSKLATSATPSTGQQASPS